MLTRRQVLLTFALALALGLFLMFWNWPVPVPESIADYPELADADPSILEEIRRADAERGKILLEQTDGGHWRLPGRGRGVIDVLERRGAAAAKPYLRHLLESRTDEPVRIIGMSFMDGELDDPTLRWLAEHGGPEARAVLLRMAGDPSLDLDLRIFGAAGAGSREAVEPLVDLALDPGTHRSLAKQVLLALPRIGAPLPDRLQALLLVPLGHRDVHAAVAFARTGDLRAPSLFLEALRDPRRRSSSSRPLVGAIRDLAADDPRVRSLAERLHETLKAEEYAAPLADAFEAWLAADPKRTDSAFERDRRAYLESDRRKHELSFRTFEDALSAADADLDLAAAALALAPLDRFDREACLERLDRLCRGIRRRLGGGESPEEVLEVLRRALLPATRMVGWAERRGSSYLPVVVEGYAGNCLGLTSLYLAVAERLDLPLHAVASPRHVFVRWDDGAVRLNVDPVSRGAMEPDEHYLDPGPGLRIVPKALESGVYLRSLSKREALGIVLANYSADLLLREKPLEALEMADRSLLLGPRNPSALICRAQARFSARPEAADAALADLEAVLRLDPGSVSALSCAADIELARGNAEEALRLSREALSVDPRWEEGVRTLTAALLALDRPKEALGFLSPRIGEAEEIGILHISRLRVLVRIDDAGWRAELDRLNEQVEREPIFNLVAAEALLDAGRVGASATAAPLLDEVDYLSNWRTHYHHLDDRKPLYFSLRARICEAKGLAEDAAELSEWAREARLNLR